MSIKRDERDYARLMRFGVLGPLEVRADGEQLAIKGAAPKASSMQPAVTAG